MEIYLLLVKNEVGEIFWYLAFCVGKSLSISFCCLWYNILQVYIQILLCIFLRRFLTCAWLASTVVTTVSCCVVKHKYQNNICPNNICIYYTELHVLLCPNNSPNNNSIYNKELHALTCPRSSSAFQKFFKSCRGINRHYNV